MGKLDYKVQYLIMIIVGWDPSWGWVSKKAAGSGRVNIGSIVSGKRRYDKSHLLAPEI